jgi:aryl-alcohol dehydrogenase-like predicted oxidoreductase
MQHQNRRNFLKSGSILGASVLASSTMSMIPVNANASSQKNEEQENVKNKERTLGTGKNSLKINHGMGLGCMGMSFNRSFIPDRNNSIGVIRKAYDMGVNFFDTAEAYGPFTNEVLVGEAIKPFRKNIILCSKFGFEIRDGNFIPGAFNSKPQHIRDVVEASLKRLQTDHIDLLYQHRVDPAVPIEDVAGTVKDLIKEGKVLRFGLSEAGVENIRKAHAVQPLTALQTELSLMTRDPLGEIFAVCEELGIGFVPYSPLSRALLTGFINERTKYNPNNDNRPGLPRYQEAAIKANWGIIEFLTDFGNQRGLTPAQVSLAWLLSLKPWVVPIPGTTKLAHLQENLWSADVELSIDELKQINEFISNFKITGDRYATPQTK